MGAGKCEVVLLGAGGSAMTVGMLHMIDPYIIEDAQDSGLPPRTSATSTVQGSSAATHQVWTAAAAAAADASYR
jgi:hypothetical protein